ncbi:MAG TPA: hypothetical protein VNS58_15830 [Puia sp.]|nr:hypothetical protein [Puia sp.]
MKKVFATILAVIYLSSSMGATIHLHYCMGKLFSWSLTDEDSKNCGHCGMPKSSMGGHCMAVKDGCCKDKHAQVKVDKDQKATESAYKFLQFSYVALPGRLAILPDLYVASYIAGYPTTNAPPDPDKVPVFIRNCTFRI